MAGPRANGLRKILLQPDMRLRPGRRPRRCWRCRAAVLAEEGGGNTQPVDTHHLTEGVEEGEGAGGRAVVVAAVLGSRYRCTSWTGAHILRYLLR
jgi:hypothetical protein